MRRPALDLARVVASRPLAASRSRREPLLEPRLVHTSAAAAPGPRLAPRPRPVPRPPLPQYVVDFMTVVPWVVVLGLTWFINHWQRLWRPLNVLVYAINNRLDLSAPVILGPINWLYDTISLALHVVDCAIKLGLLKVSRRRCCRCCRCLHPAALQPSTSPAVLLRRSAPPGVCGEGWCRVVQAAAFKEAPPPRRCGWRRSPKLLGGCQQLAPPPPAPHPCPAVRRCCTTMGTTTRPCSSCCSTCTATTPWPSSCSGSWTTGGRTQALEEPGGGAEGGGRGDGGVLRRNTNMHRSARQRIELERHCIACIASTKTPQHATAPVAALSTLPAPPPLPLPAPGAPATPPARTCSSSSGGTATCSSSTSSWWRRWCTATG
jgi:hypothetical protein